MCVCTYMQIVLWRKILKENVDTYYRGPKTPKAGFSFLISVPSSPLENDPFTLSQGKARFWQSGNVFTIQNCCSSCISVPCSASRFLVKFKKGAIPSFAGCCVEVTLQRHGFVQPPGI